MGKVADLALEFDCSRTGRRDVLSRRQGGGFQSAHRSPGKEPSGQKRLSAARLVIGEFLATFEDIDSLSGLEELFLQQLTPGYHLAQLSLKFGP